MPPEFAQLAASAWAGERALLSRDVRRDSEALDVLLDPDFREIGSSGRLWTRQEVIAALVAEVPASEAPANAAPADDGDGWVIREPVATALGDGVIHLTYLVESDGSVSRRSSVWRTDGDPIRILFHQGTPLA